MTDTQLGVVLGGLIGLAGSFINGLLNNQAESRRRIAQLGFEAGVKDWERSMQKAEQLGGKLYPLVSFVHFHTRAVEELMTRHGLTPAKVAKIAKERDDLAGAIDATQRRS